MKLKTLVFTLVLSSCAGVSYSQSNSGNPQLRAAVQQLESDVKADVANSDVTSQELQAFNASVEAIVAVAHKPDPAAVQQLATLLKQIKANGTITPSQKKELMADISAVLASAGIPQSDVTALVQSMKAIAVSSNMTKAELQQLVADVVAIVNALPSGSHQP